MRGVGAGARCSASAIASAPCTGRSSPPSDSSPANSKRVEPGGVDLAGGGEDAERDRQVEAARLLRQVGRREADRDALVVRELEAARLQRRADALARLLDLGVGEADEREARQAVGEMHLDRHRGRFEAAQGAAVDDGEGHAGRFCGRARASRRARPKVGTRRAPRPSLGADARVIAPPRAPSWGADATRLWHATCETRADLNKSSGSSMKKRSLIALAPPHSGRRSARKRRPRQRPPPRRPRPR